MKLLSFNGYDINVEKIVSVGPVTSVRTGSLSCDWDYGFILKLEGNEIPICYKSPSNTGYVGGATRDACKEEAEKLRAKFMELLND